MTPTPVKGKPRSGLDSLPSSRRATASTAETPEENDQDDKVVGRPFPADLRRRAELLAALVRNNPLQTGLLVAGGVTIVAAKCGAFGN